MSYTVTHFTLGDIGDVSIEERFVWSFASSYDLRENGKVEHKIAAIKASIKNQCKS